MRKICVVLISLAFVLGLTIPSLYAAQKTPQVSFSADFVNTEDGEAAGKGKYFASPDGIRMEGTDGGEPYVMIFNYSKNTAWHVMEKDRMYVETPIEPEKTEIATDDLFGGFVFGNPCPGQGGKSKRIGRETLQGRSVEKWRCESDSGEEIAVWYDTKLQLGIRVEDEDGTFELRNIKEGRLSGDLFLPPAGYTKLEIPSGLSFGSPSSPQKGKQAGPVPGKVQGMDRGAPKSFDQKDAETFMRGMQEGLKGLIGR